MSRGRQRGLIPPAFSDLAQWPRPDESQFTDDDAKNRYRARRDAVLMYAALALNAEILSATGQTAKQVRRFVKRCLKSNGAGGIIGFYALEFGARLEPYIRVAPVVHMKGGDSSGCAGALGQLFDRFPEIEIEMSDLYLKRSREVINEARIPYYALHSTFKEKLRAKGLGDADWPFNTKNEGYDALRRYCHSLLDDETDRAIEVRHGLEARRRSPIGRGKVGLLPLLRFMGGMVLDYHKEDAACIFVFENESHEEIEVPLERFHIGLLVEESKGLITGVCIALELTPSGDSALETVESALRPRVREEGDPTLAYVVDGKVLPNEMIPSLAQQGFAWIKVDNAWCNAAMAVVNNLIDVVGCAINFGPVRAWWRRGIIERIFGQLTRRGLQRLPSTYGKGVEDTRRNKPATQAIKFRIRIEELVAIINGVVRAHNEHASEALQFSSPLSAAQYILNHPHSGWLPQPLPRGEQADLRLLYHIETPTVRGSVEKHERPYVTISRDRHTCEKLASNYGYIGKRLVAYIDRRDPRNVTASVAETGEDLGPLRGSKRWSRFAISWRDRQFLIRGGLAKSYEQDGVDPMTRWTRAKKVEMAERAKSKAKQNKVLRNGLHYLKFEQARARANAESVPPANVVDHPRPQTSAMPPAPDPFGLDAQPDLKPIDPECKMSNPAPNPVGGPSTAHVGTPETLPCTRALDRRALLAVHPLLASTVLLPTAPSRDFCAIVKRIVLLRQSGCCFVAPSGHGKTSALLMAAEFLRQTFLGIVVLIHVALNQQVPSIRAFFKHFLSTVKHKEKRGETYDLRDRVVSTLVDRARMSPIPLVVLLFDEAQVLRLGDFLFLKDIHNGLAHSGVQFVTILMAQDPEFDAVVNIFSDDKRADLRDRFVRHVFKLRALESVDDLVTLLREIDKAEFPPASSCTWTGFFFPQAVAAGFTLESQANAFAAGLREGLLLQGRRSVFPARQTFEALRAFCVDNARFDAPSLKLTEGAWTNAAKWAELAAATQNGVGTKEPTKYKSNDG